VIACSKSCTQMTRRSVIATGLAAAVLPPSQAWAGRETLISRPDFAAVFADAGAVGCFAAFDGARDTFTLFDFERAKRRYVPASTFKIVNSLIAIETAVVRDQTEVIPYGGKPQPFPAWERDMPMIDAVPASSVPIFQEIARRVGLESYRSWLDKLDYGNGEIGDIVDRFWLDGPLEISAMEQAVFIDRLARRELPASKRAQDIAASLIKLDTQDGRTLYGKTGWVAPGTATAGAGGVEVGGAGAVGVGWWVGWVDRSIADGGLLAFALNIDMAVVADARKRIDIGKAILAKLGAWG